MTESFDILLIEDNDGDAKLIRRHLRKADDAFLPQDTSFRRKPNLSEGMKVLDEEEIDMTLLDLGLPESSGVETLHRVTEEFERVPIVVLTGLNDTKTAVQAVQGGAQDYLNKGSIDEEELGRAIRYAKERKKRREKSERQKRLRRMVQEVLVESSTRAEIEQKFCDEIVEYEPYVFVWIGDPETENGIVSRASSGNGDGYIETITKNEEYETPSIRSARSQEAEFLHIDNASGGWREAALKRGFISVASVPITYKDISYGVLSVYSDQPDFFGDIEQEVLTGISDTLSYSLNTVRKESALFSDNNTEVRIKIDKSASYFDNILESGGAENVGIEVRGTVPTEDGILQFVDIEDISPEEVLGMENSEPGVDNVELIHTEETTGSYQFTLSDTVPESYLIDLGLMVNTSSVTDDGVSVRFEVPLNRKISEVIDKVKSKFGSADVMMCKEDSRDEFERAVRFSMDELTDKQEQALRIAYHSGYFEQPKRNSAEEIAETLGVSRSTFIQHLRAAQGKLFADIFK